MSLWYESLMDDLRSCGDDAEEQAMCIVRYLAMAVPRSWWDSSMESGTISGNYISILSNSLTALSQVVCLTDKLNYGLLIALAYVNDYVWEWPSGKDNRGVSSLDEILRRAGQVLKKRPEILQLANLIEMEVKQPHSKGDL